MISKILPITAIVLCLAWCACASKKAIPVDKELVIERTSFFPKSRTPVNVPPSFEKTMVFIMAGQSNMAGRGQVMPEDTIADKHIFTINAQGNLEVAQEPLHYYEKELQGLDCGMSFAKTILKQLPKGTNIVMVPVAVGGSSTDNWLSDEVYRGVKLQTNFAEKVTAAKKYGTVKAMIWHQGESDANGPKIIHYEDNIKKLFLTLRNLAGNNDLPILMGELGNFGNKEDANWKLLNTMMHDLTKNDPNIKVVSTKALGHKGDNLHFDSEGQRSLGKQFAEAYYSTYYEKP